MKLSPRVSVVIPCRNEERFIGQCLDSLLAQDYPKDALEVLVIDGASRDRTRDIVARYQRKHPFVQVVENASGYTPVAMNIGIHRSRGEIVMIMGAHSTLAPDYVSKCVEALEAYGADVAGGSLRTKPSAPTLVAKAVALVLSHPFGTGGSKFRLGVSRIREADTAFNACFRKTIFAKVGFLNENLIRSQDMELSIRIKQAGGKIILVPDAVASYFPKATLGGFWKHNIADGTWAVLPVKFGAKLFRPRHLLPLAFVLGLAGSALLSVWFPQFRLLFSGVLGLYLASSLAASLHLSLRERDARLLPALLAAFAVRHFGYGLGSLLGLMKLVV